MALKTNITESDLGEDEGGPAILAEINITPLTDIFLVLLIIFMVTSTVMSQLGVNVDLPKAESALSASQSDGVIVTLLPSGKMQINDEMIESQDRKHFVEAIKVAFKKTPSRFVIFEGDRKVLLGNAIELMEQAKLAGAEKFAIATAPTK